jgi:hypothetical protein
VDDEKELVGVVVMMSDKLALEPGELDLLAVQLTRDARAPVIGEGGELLCRLTASITERLLLESFS